MDEPQEPVAAPGSASAEASTAAAPSREAPPVEALAAEPEPTAEIPAPSEAGTHTEHVAPGAPTEILSTGESALPAEMEPQEAPPPAAPEPAPQTAVSSPEPPPAASLAPTPTTNWNTEYQPKGKQAQKARVEVHLEKILAHAHTKKTISNKDVVKLLRVSDATASRYLKILVSRGQLQKIGKGRSVAYHIAML